MHLRFLQRMYINIIRNWTVEIPVDFGIGNIKTSPVTRKRLLFFL